MAMLLVGFTIQFAGALGGYWAAGATASILAFVLAVMAGGPVSELGSRELGWSVGVLVAGISAVLLWPVHQRNRVRGSRGRGGAGRRPRG